MSFVIWTRYVSPHSGAVVRHVYGPYETRGKANTVRRRMLRDAEQHYSQAELDAIECVVTRMHP